MVAYCSSWPSICGHVLKCLGWARGAGERKSFLSPGHLFPPHFLLSPVLIIVKRLLGCLSGSPRSYHSTWESSPGAWAVPLVLDNEPSPSHTHTEEKKNVELVSLERRNLLQRSYSGVSLFVSSHQSDSEKSKVRIAATQIFPSQKIRRQLGEWRIDREFKKKKKN